MKVKVLFVMPNLKGNYEDAYSFGVASIAALVNKKGFEYDVIVINHIEEFDAFFSLVEEMQPTVIGYSSVSSQFIFVKELAEKVKERYSNDIVQVVGGVHPTIYPKCILETDALDATFVGESEYAFVDLLERLSINLPYKDIKNLAYNDNLFYCYNRESIELRGGEKNEFFNYPWHSEDQHSIEEVVPWHNYFLGLKRTKRGPTLLGVRIPFVNFYDGKLIHRLSTLKIENERNY